MGGATGREEMSGSLYPRAVLHRVFTNISIYTAGEVLGRLTVFALVPVYTVLLPPEELALWGLGAMLLQGLTVLYGLGTQGALPQLQYPLLDKPQQLRATNGSAAMLLLLWGPALHLVLEAVAPALLARWLPGLPWDPYGRIVSLTCLASVTGIVPIARWTSTERAKPYVAASVGRSLVEFAMTLGLLLGTEMGVLALFLGRFAAHAVLALPLLWVTLRSVRWGIRLPELKPLLGFALPLIPDLLAMWALTMADRVLLAWLADERELGLYTAAYWFPLAMGLVAININRAWAPTFHKGHAEPSARPALARSSTAFLLGMSWLGVAVAALAPDVVRFGFGSDYADAAGIAGVLGLLGPLLGAWQIVVAPLYAHLKRFTIPAVTGTAAVLGVALDVWAIPRWGAIGAAGATVAAYGALVSMGLVATRNLERAPVDVAFVYRGGAVLAGVLGAASVGPSELLGVGFDLVLLGAAGAWLVARLRG